MKTMCSGGVANLMRKPTCWHLQFMLWQWGVANWIERVGGGGGGSGNGAETRSNRHRLIDHQLIDQSAPAVINLSVCLCASLPYREQKEPRRRRRSLGERSHLTASDTWEVCTEAVKTALFRVYSTRLYSPSVVQLQLRKKKRKKIQVAFNETFRILLKLPRRTSASRMFVTRNVPTFHSVLRNCVYIYIYTIIYI